MTSGVLKNTMLAVMAVGFLSACSSESEKKPSLGSVAMGMAKARFKRGKVEKADKAVAGTPQKLPLAALAKYGKPVIYVTVPRLGTSLPAIEVARNGSTRTYMGGDKATVTTRNGMVTATRGQFVDLFAQSLSLSPNQIFYGGSFPKVFTRSQRHLNGEGKLETFTYNCAIGLSDADEKLDVLGRIVTVRRYTEVCKNAVRGFQNSYWIDRRAHRIWKSHQSISKEIGHMILQLAIP